MRNPFSIPPRLLRGLNRRLRKARPGSVLILCVALLVLLALIGTAMISTSRVDRYSSVQHTINTEVDLLVQGVKQMAEAEIVGDLFDTSQSPAAYRAPLYSPVPPALATSTYDHWDMPCVDGNYQPAPPQEDLFLASRYPELPNVYLPQSATNSIVWKAITAPLVMDVTGALSSTIEFEEPYVNPAPGDAFTSGFTTNPVINAHYHQATNVTPFSFTIKYQDGTPPLTVPAFTYTNGAAICQAADADGDGIADCGLFRLPVGPINGVTYYAGVRIVDNNSAINVNSAWSQQYDFGPSNGTAYITGTGSPSVTAATGLAATAGNVSDAIGFYRTNVGLLEMLHTYNSGTKTSAEMDALNLRRWGISQTGASTGSASLVPAPEPQPGNAFAFGYANQGDAMDSGLIRRVDNPDKNGTGASATSFTPFSISDQTALASGFCVRNPQNSPSELETVLPQSIGTLSTAHVGPYSPSDVANWFSNNFWWDEGVPAGTTNTSPSPRPTNSVAPILPLRSMLVARNPVSNFAPAVTPATPPVVPQPLIPTGPAFPDRTLTGMLGYSTLTSGASTVANVVKTDVNTAAFPELWRAYWSVMAGNNVTAGDPTQPPFPSSGITDGLMFRSTIRNTTVVIGADTGSLTASEMLQLRSALAAINTLQLRTYDADGNQTLTGTGDIISREIPLYNIPDKNAGDWPPNPTTPAATARIFGVDKQPFITEIYANTWTNPDPQLGANPPANSPTNPSGYVAVELYNPYPVNLVLNHWAIGTINRGVASLNVGTLAGTQPPPATPIPTSTAILPTGGYGADVGFLGGGTLVIPQNSYVILENYPPGGAKLNSGDAAYRPNAASRAITAGTGHLTQTVYVPNLQQVIGQEMVLLRPHFAARPATPPSIDYTFDATSNLAQYKYDSKLTADQPDMYYEGTVAAPGPNLNDFIPADSFDFSGMPAPTTGETTGTSWYYVRNSTQPWQFVYPGRYQRYATPRIQTTTVATTTTSATGTVTDDGLATGLGVADNPALNNWPGVQLANLNWAGPNRGQPVFPFGAFARNGDILQVPFIGNYQIRLPTVPASITGAPAPFCEMNAVTMDCSFSDDQVRKPDAPAADDGTPDPTDTQGGGDDTQEQLGRFCPIFMPSAVVDDADMTKSYTSGWRYHFAEKLFDYLTVQSPASDYKPNIDPSNPFAGYEIPVQNGSATAANPNLNVNVGNENTVGVNGLININTAPWWVLASLPLLPNNIAGPDNNKNGIPDNIEDLAKQIETWRDTTAPNVVHGPFRSIMDLNRVTDAAQNIHYFRDALTYYGGAAYTSQPTDGYISPTSGAGNSGVPNDFEKENVMLNRISNLITTRSDSFTVYIVVQGWKNAGTDQPKLVAQHRAAFIIDRSNVTAVSGAESPKITTVPTD